MTITIDSWFGWILAFVLFTPAAFLFGFMCVGARSLVKNWLRFGASAKPYRRWKQRRREARA